MSQYVKDLVERVIATFVMAFLAASLVAAPDGGVSIEASQAAVVAGVAAVASLVKGIAAKYLGSNHESASLTV